MKLEIDTEKDSQHEFRAAIRLLEALLGEQREERAPSIMDASSGTPASPGLMSMFDASNAEHPDTPATERPESPRRPAQVWDTEDDEPRMEPY